MKISFKHKLKQYFVNCNAWRFGNRFIAFGRINKVQPIIFAEEPRSVIAHTIYLSDIKRALQEIEAKKITNVNKNIPKETKENSDNIFSTYMNAVSQCKQIMEEDNKLKNEMFNACEFENVVIRCSIDNFLLISDYLVEYKKGSRMKYDFEKDYMLIVPYMKLSIPLREIVNYDDFDLVKYHGVYDELDDAMDGEALANLCIVSRNDRVKEIV